MDSVETSVITTKSALITAKTFSLIGNDIPVENVITKLKFLSKVKPGEKINVKHLFTRSTNSDDWYQNWYHKFLRTITTIISGGESKEETREFVKFIYDEAINLICAYNSELYDEFKKSIIELIVENLNSSKDGINALKETYKDDSRFISQIDTIVETMEVRLKSVRPESSKVPE